MNIEEKLVQTLTDIAKEKYGIEAEDGLIMVEIPKDNSKGDYSTNLAMRLTKVLKRRPQEIAQEIREELLKSFGLSGRYCKNCKNWTVEEGEYGNCAYEKHCLMHRSESCDRFEARQSTVDSKQGDGNG